MYRYLSASAGMALAICMASDAVAQGASPTATTPPAAAPKPMGDVTCAGGQCVSPEGVVMRVRTRVER